MPQRLAAKLKYLRRHHSITQGSLANAVGLETHSHIAKLEAGEAPSLTLVVRLAQYLGVSIDYLIRDTIAVEDMRPRPSALAATNCALERFGPHLRDLRQRHKLSQREFAGRLGLASRAYIGGLEGGSGKLPSLDLVVRMADLFGISTDELLCGTTGDDTT